MSENETHMGKIHPVDLMHFKTPEEYLLSHEGIELNNEDDYIDLVDSHDYIIHKGKLYLIDDMRLNPYGHEEATQDSLGVISYSATYYNGAAGWGEVVSDLIDKALGEKND